MFCSDCGKEVKDGASFCPECGKATGTSASTAKVSQGLSDKQKKNAIIGGVVAVAVIVAIVIFLNVGGSPLVGTWDFSHRSFMGPIVEGYVEFRRNGTGTIRQYQNNDNIMRTVTFRWSYDGDALTVIHEVNEQAVIDSSVIHTRMIPYVRAVLMEGRQSFSIVGSGRNAVLMIASGVSGSSSSRLYRR